MQAIKFLIFNLDIKRTQQVENYFSDNNFTSQIEEWFALRDLNKSLKKELIQNNNHISKLKVKI
jgi:hypothetical protein